MDWSDPALQGFFGAVIGALAAIAGAWVGAWWVGKSTRETAALDRAAVAANAEADRRAVQIQAELERANAAEQAVEERLHQDRTGLIGRISEHVARVDDLYLALLPLGREMKDLANAAPTERVVSLGKEFRELFRQGSADFWAQFTDITLATSLFIDPSSTKDLERSHAAVKRRHKAILRNALRDHESQGDTKTPTDRYLGIVNDQLAYLQELDLHYRRLTIFLAKATNPGMREWLEKQMPEYDESNDVLALRAS